MKSRAVRERGGDYKQRFTYLENSLSQGKNSEEENTRRGVGCMQRENNDAVWQEKGMKRGWGYRDTDVLPSLLSGQKGRRRQQVFL